MLPMGFSPEGKRIVTLVWCIEGEAKINISDENICLKSQESVWIEDCDAAEKNLQVSYVEGEFAKLMLAKVAFI